MVDELDLNAPNDLVEEQSKKQVIGNLTLKAPKKKRKVLKWVIISVAVLIVILFSIFFIGLVKTSIDQISGNDNSSIFDITTTDDPYAGSLEAKIVIVEFSDFQCPYCFQSFPTVREIIDIYGDQIRFIYRDFPIDDIHPQAQNAAEAGECASEQDKFWEYHDKLFINQDNLSLDALKYYASEIGLDTDTFDECLDSHRYYEEVQQDFASGIIAGVEGTPTFFINDVKFQGAITVENFKNIIDQLLVIFQQPGE